MAKKYLVYLAQSYPNFRKAELESLAVLNNIKVDLSSHDESSPFMIVELENDDEAYRWIDRSILSRGIYELWGHGANLEELHRNVQETSKQYWDEYMETSFKFDIISYQGGKRSRKQQIELFETFSYLAFKGAIKMKSPDQTFTILEKYHVIDRKPVEIADYIWFGREINLSARSKGALDKYLIPQRPYYGTTTFDSELALITCNLSLCGPGKFMYDPFTGTGAFLYAGAFFGSSVFGSDIDVRPLRGKNKDKTIKKNFEYYKTSTLFCDAVCMDFTNNSFRKDFLIDSIVCDPPYGVREGLKVCGTKREDRFETKKDLIIEGEKAYLRRDFVQPKKPYELDSLLDDLLKFSAEKLPIGGRLSFWMPTANDDFVPTIIPQHENLELVYSLVQDFNKWARRLLVYVKRDNNYKGITLTKDQRTVANNFRDRYFTGFSPNTCQNKDSNMNKEEQSSS